MKKSRVGLAAEEQQLKEENHKLREEGCGIRNEAKDRSLRDGEKERHMVETEAVQS